MDQHSSRSFNALDNPIKGIEAMSHRLRGGNSKDEDPAGVMEKLKGFMQSLSTSLGAIQNSYNNGDTEESGKALKILVGDDIESIAKTTKDTKLSQGELFNSENSIEGITSLKDIPNSIIGEHIQPQIFDKIASLSADFTQTLEGLDMSIFTESPSKKRNNLHSSSRSSHHQGKKPAPKKEGQPQFNFGNDFSFFQDAGAFGNFMKNPTVKNIHKQMKGQRKGISLPKISTLVSVRDYETVMSKHQLRQGAMGVCLPQCSLADEGCNCRKLFDCVKKLDEYDLAV